MRRTYLATIASLLGALALERTASAQTVAAPPCQPIVRIPIAGNVGRDGAWRAPRGGGPQSAVQVDTSHCPPAQPPGANPPSVDANGGASGAGANAGANAGEGASASASGASAGASVDVLALEGPPGAAAQGAQATTAGGGVQVGVQPAAPAPVQRLDVLALEERVPAQPVARGGGPAPGARGARAQGALVITHAAAAPPPPRMAPVVYAPAHPAALQPRTERPRLVIGGAFGGGDFQDHGFDTRTGYAWHVELGVSVARVVTLAGRYHGVYAPSRDVGGSYVLGTGAAGLLRLTLPTPVLRPFVHGGVGWYRFDARGGLHELLGNARRDMGQIPIGGGLELSLHRSVALTGEFTYHVVFGDRFDSDAVRPWGNLWAATGGVRFHL